MSDKPGVTRVRDGKKVAGAAPRGKAGARVGKKAAPALPIPGRPGNSLSRVHLELLVLDLFDPGQRQALWRVVHLHALALDNGVPPAQLGRVEAIRGYLLGYLESLLSRLPIERGAGLSEEFVITAPGVAHVRRHAGSDGLEQERLIARLEVIGALRPGATSDEKAQKDQAQSRLRSVVFRIERRAAASAVSEFIDVARSVADELEQGEDKPEGGFVSLVEDLMRAWDSCAVAVMRPFVLASLRDSAVRLRNKASNQTKFDPDSAGPWRRQANLYRYMADANLEALSTEQRREMAKRFNVHERTVRNDLKALETEGPSRGLPWPPRS